MTPVAIARLLQDRKRLDDEPGEGGAGAPAAIGDAGATQAKLVCL